MRFYESLLQPLTSADNKDRDDYLILGSQEARYVKSRPKDIFPRQIELELTPNQAQVAASYYINEDGERIAWARSDYAEYGIVFDPAKPEVVGVIYGQDKFTYRTEDPMDLNMIYVLGN